MRDAQDPDLPLVPLEQSPLLRDNPAGQLTLPFQKVGNAVWDGFSKFVLLLFHLVGKAQLSVAELGSPHLELFPALEWDWDFCAAFSHKPVPSFWQQGEAKKLLPGGGQAGSLLPLALTDLLNSAGLAAPLGTALQLQGCACFCDN